ncbi:MAG: hypothetical protein VYE68_07845 [Acidobacteriota bacterium]|nr:hypothetical protein [Acidobacteriota bacterium]
MCISTHPVRPHHPLVMFVVCLAAMGLGAGLVGSARDTLALDDKAVLFWADLVERFVEDGQVRVRRRLPTVERPYVTYNMSDSAYATGLYVATATFRFLATGDPVAAVEARAAAEALRHLVSVTGRSGLLARASVASDRPWFDDGVWRLTDDGRYRWRGRVSSDQVDALMFGLSVFGLELADTSERIAVGETVRAVVDTVLANGSRIIGYDGQPTRWGHYEPEYVSREEPMNALLLLQMTKVAHALTQLPRYDEAYRRLIDLGYAEIGERARLDEPPLEANHSDDVLIALALYPLLELEEDPVIRAHYLEAARRWYRGGRYPGIDVEANPFATFLYQHWTGENGGHLDALEALRRVPLDMKWNPDTIATYATRFGFTFVADPVTPWEGTEPLTMGQRGRTWSFLVHNPYQSGGNRLEPAPFETNGLDFLLSYWFGRAHGMVDAGS